MSTLEIDYVPKQNYGCVMFNDISISLFTDASIIIGKNQVCIGGIFVYFKEFKFDKEKECLNYVIKTPQYIIKTKTDRTDLFELYAIYYSLYCGIRSEILLFDQDKRDRKFSHINIFTDNDQAVQSLNNTLLNNNREITIGNKSQYREFDDEISRQNISNSIKIISQKLDLPIYIWKCRAHVQKDKENIEEFYVKYMEDFKFYNGGQQITRKDASIIIHYNNVIDRLVSLANKNFTAH